MLELFVRMDIFAGLSSFVKEAGSQFENLVQNVVMEGGDERRTDPQRRKVEVEASRKALCEANLSPLLVEFIIGIGQNIEGAKRVVLRRFEQNPESADGFTMTPGRIKHARAVIKVVPGVDQLRFHLCPSVMADKTFWSIYFKLVESGNDELKQLIVELGSSGSLPAMNTQQKPQGRGKQGESGESSMVSNILHSAKKTLKFAEQLIETVDEQASFVIRPAFVPPTVLESASSVEEYSSVATQAMKLSEIDQSVSKKGPLKDRSSSCETTNKSNACREKSRSEGGVPLKRTEPEEEDGWSHVVVHDDEVVVCDSPSMSTS